MSEELKKEISELKEMISGLAGTVKTLSNTVNQLSDERLSSSALAPDVVLALKRIAAADAAGDPGPRRLWNAQRRKELAAERGLQRSRS